MIKVDLITGFLGSGKTTFIKKYATYLMAKGQRIGILENDYGAVNVDMMLLQDIKGEQCELEMVAGGCDADCHRRRFKTKLIAMGMSGYDRVLIEPSGIFDVDEFFDVLYEEPLSGWYEIGNVFAIVDAKLEDGLSRQSDYMLASQIAHAGKVILSRSQDEQDVEHVQKHMNNAMEMFQCNRRFTGYQMLAKDWDSLTDEDYEELLHAGYREADFVKEFGDFSYNAVYIMHSKLSVEEMRSAVQDLLKDENCGNVFRVKGFIPTEEEGWMELNATRKELVVKPIAQGQEILIVIGENLKEDLIRSQLGDRGC